MKIEWHQLDRRHERLRARRPGREKQLIASLAQLGQLVPITVIREPVTSGPEPFLVIDGFRRIRALAALRHDAAEATVLDLPELEALLYHHAQRSGEDETVVEQAWLVAELSDRFGLSLEALAGRLGRSASWVSRRLALVRELPESVQDLVREGRIGAHAAMRSLVPLARAKPEECARLAAAIAPLDLTSRELAAVVATWWRSPPGVKQRILESPRLFLSAQREQARGGSRCESAAPPSPSPSIAPPPPAREPPSADAQSPVGPTVALLQDLDLLATVAMSLVERWESDSAELDTRQWAQVRHSLDRARSLLDSIPLQEAL